MLPGVLAGELSASVRETGMSTNPVQVIDLAVSLPVCILVGIWLWQRRPWGFALAGILLLFNAIEALGVAVDQWFAANCGPGVLGRSRPRLPPSHRRAMRAHGRVPRPDARPGRPRPHLPLGVRMPTATDVQDFLDQKHVAFVGISRNDKDFANSVYRSMRDAGRTMYPVHRDAAVTTVSGDPVYHRLADVPDPVDGVVVMVPAASAADVVQDALDRGIPRVWLYRGAGQGAVSPEAVELCRSQGVPVVDGACPFMFDGRPAGVHRVHAWFSGRRIARRG